MLARLGGCRPALFGQSAELDRLVAESARIRSLTPTQKYAGHDTFGSVKRPDWTGLKNLLRDWIESRLPANATELDAEFPSLEARLTADLQRAGLLEPEKATADAGYIASLKLSRAAEYPGGLMVQAGITVPCGSDGSIYLYHFTTATRARVLDASGAREWGNNLLETRLTAPDSSGSRVFYASWDAVQCASVWNGIDYRLFRIDRDRSMPLFSDTHSWVMDDDVHVKLTPQELLVELPAEAMEAGFRRTHVLHYRIGLKGVERIDPVALQPQDFVHEWLTHSWDEMQSRSSGEVSKWHRFLHTDFVGGEYVIAQPCADRTGFTQVVVEVSRVGERELSEPLNISFLVHDKGDYHYEMSEISFTRQSGCPGETYDTYDNLPSLFKKN